MPALGRHGDPYEVPGDLTWPLTPSSVAMS